MKVKELWVYPIKSLDGISVDFLNVGPEKRLSDDRRYSIVDEAGEVFNAKRSHLVQKIRIGFSDDLKECEIEGNTYELSSKNEDLNKRLSELLEEKVELKDNGPSPIPDRPFWPGPNLVSEQALIEMASWYENISRDELIRRFRTNMVLDEPNLPAFWEELILSQGATLQFDSAELIEFRSCERCPVPARDSLSGEPTRGFQKEFIQKREDFKAGLNGFGTKHLYYFSLVSKIGDMGSNPGFSLGEEVLIQGLQEY